MKHLLFIIVLLNCTVRAQEVRVLYGAHANGAANVYGAVVLPGFSYSQLNSLAGTFNPSPGETTYDENGHRYFIKSGTEILIIDALTGSMLDTIKNAGNFYNFEYDVSANHLIGLSFMGNDVMSCVCKLPSKLFSVKASMAVVDSIVVGESTFDPIRRRYFTMTDVGMIAIDSTGALEMVLCASPYLNGIEYDITSNKVYYLEWKDGNFDLNLVDAVSCSPGYVCSLIADTIVLPGESTFDRQLGIYYTQTNFGITQIDVQSGQVLQTLSTSGFAQMEFARINTTGLNARENHPVHGVFPNPGTGLFQFRCAADVTLIEVYDLSGKKVCIQSERPSVFNLDLRDLSSGVYFYNLTYANREPERGRLIVTRLN